MSRCAPDLNSLIIAVSLAHRARAAAMLAEHGLHPGQEKLLFELWNDDGQTQTQLASRLNVQAPTINKMVGRMEAAGLVERRAAPDDGRAARVYITERAAALQPVLRELWQNLETQTAQELSAEEQKTLSALLERVQSNLRGDDPSGSGC